ncbi:methyltransferase domain-containing protein [Flavobacterium sp. J49]|uniref:methyltransferase domain-containing protein n=1 Tax=Flavobacterium sp. J49 TaxID=2718534 RepID=UPI001592D879|nr:methyltransferase domain-containing protein [Flavobacterium sp. J49]MBF6642093.1 methyltransferase domain-containing protein [Flavobacterium sp. J49]NIC03340.1 methyltransferase domain-containing protein [Flavobacterium sp. J49]
MMIDTKYRTNESEIMDDFALEGETLRDALDKIAKINRLLGGNQLTLQGVQQLLKGIPKDREITIVDIGCGNGDMLRSLADYGKQNNYRFKLIGIDANAFTVSHAKTLSKAQENISYQCQDIFENKFKALQYDIVLCTLTLHHFKDEEILSLVKVFYENASIGIVINDLHRSAMAYRLFQALCFVFRLNEMSREDGLVSILRGFKKAELENYSKALQLKKYTIQWKWAFRYQWIINKTN